MTNTMIFRFDDVRNVTRELNLWVNEVVFFQSALNLRFSLIA